ncbi:contact-dependent growth inhibition system immunity protein [Streptomyces sp. AC602_WCS936]|uniref:contact-dependent growth inhibition system immunity protein n=1 Tax=Streptomyces sp. AC602_WCS936 TaxID=2823685 RepID=UPI001C267EB5|nr:contact-dependent growth inhibition system immunity protein [Streptomyces sp. AC602_WCS936]
MSSFPGPGFRFYEVQDLLAAYAAHDYTFSDSPEAPGPALSAYLRIVSEDPRRAATAVQQLDELLRAGLGSSEIADDVELLPEIVPPSGRSVEDCLRIIRGHLVRQIENPVPAVQSVPTGKWEYQARFPELNQFLGGYFHQDFFEEYASYSEAVGDYLSGASEGDREQLVRDISDLLSLATTDRELKQATSVLGMDVSPPSGIGIRQWLNDVHDIVSRYSRE